MTEEPEHQQAPAAPPVATSPLGDWRAPLFWMACGALMAGVAGGAVLVAQRIGVERDMAAVAALVPPPSAPAEIAATPVLATTSAAASPPAAPPTPTAKSTPAAPKVRVARGAAEQQVKGKRAGTASKATRYALQEGRKAGRPRAIRSKAAGEKSLYWKVFKRCPLPGEPGAVECRRHICNGAEKYGPACKAYRGKWR